MDEKNIFSAMNKVDIRKFNESSRARKGTS